MNDAAIERADVREQSREIDPKVTSKLPPSQESKRPVELIVQPEHRLDEQVTQDQRRRSLSMRGGVTTLRQHWVALTVLLVVLVVLILPALALLTPLGQRYVANAIEAPLLARLQAAVPAPFELHVDRLETRIRPSSIEVEFIGARVEAPGVALEIDEADVRVRYVDVFRQNPVPRSVRIGSVEISLNEPVDPAFQITDENGKVRDPPTFFSIFGDLQSEPRAPVTATVDPNILPENTSSRLDEFLAGLDLIDRQLASLTVDETWQSMRTITVERIDILPQPDASLPMLREANRLTLQVTRESEREVVARLTTIARPTPLSLTVRHAESGAPEGPAMLAEVVGTSSLDGQAFSHVLLRGLNVGDLTDAFTSEGPIQFESELASELVITRTEDESAIDQVALLFESGAGYLIASGSEATILEFAAVPMIYTRETGRFDIVSAQLRFQDTGGFFNGYIGPQIKHGVPGLGVVLGSPRYSLAVPASQPLGRQFTAMEAQIALNAHIPDGQQLLDISLFSMSVENAMIGMSGILEVTERGPIVSLAALSSPMRSPQLAAMWPLPISPQARSWFLENVAEGRVGAGTMSFSAALNEIETIEGRAYLDDDMLALSVPYENLVLRTPGQLPPVFGLDGTINVTGRTVRMTGEGGVGRVQSGQTMQVGPVEFYIPDHAEAIPDGILTLTLEGEAGGFIELAALDPINLADDLPFEPGNVTGHAVMTTRIESPLADEVDRDDVRATMDAQITEFSSTVPVEGRQLTDGVFAISADENGLLVTGRAQLDGVPTEINFTDGDQGGLRVALRLDAAGRERMGLDFGPYLTGSVDVDVGVEQPDGTRTLQVDLTDATLTIAELGYEKPPGSTARASFDVREDGNQRFIRNLRITANGLDVRGSLDFLNGDLRVAEFDRLALQDVGSVSLDLTRNSSGTSARLRGDRFVLRPDILRSDPESVGALTLDVQVDQLVTEGGSQLSDVRLTYSQNETRITNFDLRARHRDGTDLVGTLAPEGGNNNLIISSGNAGTFLRFLGLYQRAEGGRATLVLEPESVGGRVAGQLLLSDFVIVNEPAMSRIFSADTASSDGSSDIVLPGNFETSDRVQIEVTRISFDRTPERLELTRVEGWGPSLGGNIRGVIDYEQDRVNLRGTFVPFFTLNNVFSRIPILGALLGNRVTEGLIGITFELVGTVDQPQLRVNPISILAPGAIRNIFEFQERQGGG